MTMINAYDPAKSADVPAREQEMIARRRRLLGPAYRLFYADPVHVTRGEGVWLYDPEGNAYLDVYNNVASVGHCHPHVVAALSRQAAVLNTHTRYLHESVLEYAERLLGHFPTGLGHVMFTCTGSEANDLAFASPKPVTGGTDHRDRYAYHGVTTRSPNLALPGARAFLRRHVRTVPAPVPIGTPRRHRRRLRRPACVAPRRYAGERHQACRPDRRHDLFERRHLCRSAGFPRRTLST